MSENKYTVVIGGKTAQDLKDNVIELAQSYGQKITGAVNTVAQAPTQDQVEETLKSSTKEAPKSANRGNTKKPAKPTEDPFAAEEKATVADNPFSDEPAEPEVAPITFLDVRNKLDEINKDPKKGVDAVVKILQALGVAKVSAIKEADYAKAMALCEKELKG